MREVEEKRTKNSKTFDLGDGKLKAEIGNHSHAMKNGIWIPTDATIDAEDGTDSDTGLQYMAKSRSASLDFDIKFGKNDPVWMKIKHIPTGDKITFKPKNNRNKPDHTIVGNKISVSQVWDGIDMEIFVRDFGIKTNYKITSTAGQRIVEFDVTGDTTKWNRGPAIYFVPGSGDVRVPEILFSGTLAYDFRNLPVGTVVDPTFTSSTSTTSTYDFCARATAGTWADTIAATTANDTFYDAANLFSAVYSGTYRCYRAWVVWDTSSIPAGSTIDSGSVRLTVWSTGSGGQRVFLSNSTLPPSADDFNNYSSTQASDDTVTPSSTGNKTWTLNASGLASVNMGVGAYTQFCVRHEKDYTATAPSSTDECGYYSRETCSGDSNCPQLTLTYTEASTGQPRLARPEHLRRFVFGPRVF